MELVIALLCSIICLLTIVLLLLLIILLKKACKQCYKKTLQSNTEGAALGMNDLESTPEPDNPNNEPISPSNILQTYTACSDDSSTSSSESLCDSNGDKHGDKTQQCVSLNPTLQSAHYENISEGKSTSALNYKKKNANKNRDYINITEEQNISLSKGRKSKTKKYPVEQDESQTSSESSSDESEADAVNYSIVVFTEATTAAQSKQ